MAILSWNCLGLGRAQDLVIPRLRELRQELFPDILFLMETKQNRDALVDLQVWLGYDKIMTVNPIGYSGGLALLWKDSVNISFKYVDKHLVDMEVHFGKDFFYLSCVYGEPVRKKRPRLWERLSRIGVGRKDPWCIVGDFNEIRHNGEKIGGPRRSEESFVPFNNMLEIGEMVELQSTGINLTWGGQRATHYIHSRLDRAFGNKKWFATFPASNQVFLDKRGSDHRSVVVKLISSSESYRGSFRFDSRFLGKPGVKEEIKKAWLTNHSFNGSPVSENLKRCRKALSRWKKNANFNSRDKIKQIQVALEQVQSSSYPSTVRLQYLKSELVKAYREEEQYLRQRSKEKWAIKGDRNTKFYHASVKSTRARNRIIKLMDEQGQPQFSEAAKAEVASAYFSKLFKSSTAGDFEEFFSDFTPRVSSTMNEILSREVSKEDVRNAVFSINASSAPGPDGMTGLFFQKYWDTVGDQITTEVQNFFVSGVFPVEWNYTHLCLLPKVVDPVLMSDLRPISLCSVLYKIISKIMAGRLKPLLPDIVSPSQSAFVEERLISDNILIAHEMIHALRTNEKISSDFMAIKSDMSKAYDRVEWGYLKALLLALGFNTVWVERLMFCVTTVTYSTLINDRPFGCIRPERGIRQGDPISPFLFVLCTEGFIHLMDKAVSRGLIRGIQFSDEGPMVHHMLFADDSLLICRAIEPEAEEMMLILKIYSQASGQLVNLEKSAITFGSKVQFSVKERIKEITGIMKEGGTGTYLGLPECFSGSKTEMLAYIYDRLKGRLSGYYVKLLSLGGKEVLLKAVAMAMPVYAMSCFKLTKKSCENLTKAMAEFWWNSLEHKRKIHWLSWAKMSLAKELGGLGFKDIQSFNQALLAKQAWRILDHPDSLFARVFKSRYFNQSEFLEAPMGSRPSYAWRSIQFGKELLIQGLRKQLGNGKSVSVWVDDWIEGDIRRRPLMKNIFVDLLLKVSDLIDFHNKCWRLSVLQELFFEEDIQRILAMKTVFDVDDYWIWVHNRNGCYSVRSGYWMKNRMAREVDIREAEARPSLNVLKVEVWKLRAPPKIQNFLWKVVSNAIPVGELLVKRGIKLDPTCQACGSQDESINHLLFSCPRARHVWALSGIPWPENGFDEVSHYANIYYLILMANNRDLAQATRDAIPWTVWYLWKTRNAILFESKDIMPPEITDKIREEAGFWSLAQQVDQERLKEEKAASKDLSRRWYSPIRGWLKCNVGVAWDKVTKRGGGAWVIRDYRGKVILHSRRAFSNVRSLLDAKFEALLWAVDSIRDHRLNHVILAVEDKTLTGMILRPKAWPNFKFYSSKLLERLSALEWWRIIFEDRHCNRGAFLIAQSVTRGGYVRSYVASGAPLWLHELFGNEESSPSL